MWPSARVNKASRCLAGIARRPLLSSARCVTPRNTIPPLTKRSLAVSAHFDPLFTTIATIRNRNWYVNTLSLCLQRLSYFVVADIKLHAKEILSVAIETNLTTHGRNILKLCVDAT